MKYVDDPFPKAAITVDVILFSFWHQSFALIKRKGEPYAGHWALPGGYFNPYDHEGERADATLQHAARRELTEEIPSLVGKPFLKDITFQFYLDAENRHPGKRVIDFVYGCVIGEGDVDLPELVAGDDAAEAKWFHKDSLPKDLAFDHREAINRFVTKTLFPNRSIDVFNFKQ